MLSSIHPLGERTRHNIWGITVGAFIVGAVAGGIMLGVLAGGVGGVGHMLIPWSPRNAFVAAIGVVGLATVGDLLRGSRALPWPQRQVNEDWLTTYRGWVYGAGFGFQLGGGLFTYITTLAVLATIAVAVLSASVLVGAVIGAAFGLFRGLAVLTTSRVSDPLALRSFHAGMARLAQPVRFLALAAQVALVFGAFVVVVVS